MYGAQSTKTTIKMSQQNNVTAIFMDFDSNCIIGHKVPIRFELYLNNDITDYNIFKLCYSKHNKNLY